MKLVTEFGMEWNGTVCGIVEWGLELCCVVWEWCCVVWEWGWCCLRRYVFLRRVGVNALTDLFLVS